MTVFSLHFITINGLYLTVNRRKRSQVKCGFILESSSRNNLSVMSGEIFKEVKETDIPKVLNALREDWPRHFLLNQILTTLDEYKKAGTKWKHTLYLFGDYESGVYLNQINVKLPEREQLYFHIYTLNSDLEPMTRALKDTKVIPWKKSISFEMGQSKFTEALVEAFKVKLVVYEISSNTMFWYPPSKHLEIQPLPEDTYLDFLDGSFAEEMNNNWPHRFPGSELIHKENLEKNFGLGLFKKDSKKLVSSALSNYTGGIFVLFSDPEYRGRGYARIVVQHMVKELRTRGKIPFCTVILGNTSSEKVFISSGFEAFTRADYIFPK